jgi:flagellar basal-body rod protein FlgF
LIKGIYTAGSGMMLQMARQDVVANNIANVNTYGYKKNTTLCRTFPEMLISRLGETVVDSQGVSHSMQPIAIGRLGTGAVLDRIMTDYSPGNLKKTDNPTDLIISNNGTYTIITPQGEEQATNAGTLFFVVQTPQGEERFTRDGAFKISQGRLINNEGYTVLDTDNNPITINGDFDINQNGQVIINDEVVATLKVAHFDNPEVLEKVNSTWRSNQPYNQVTNPQIMQGYIEESNVNAVKEMVDLITITRCYESLQKMIQAEDETLQVAIDQVASQQ